jgi:hypothetical protein
MEAADELAATEAVVECGCTEESPLSEQAARFSHRRTNPTTTSTARGSSWSMSSLSLDFISERHPPR